MLQYTIKRVSSVLLVLFVVSIVLFTIIHMTPGDPARVMLGPEASSDQVEELREDMGLNAPLYEQYFAWVGKLFQGDLGTSYFMKQPVTQSIFEHLKPTLTIAGLGMFFTLIIAIPLGIAAAKRRGSHADTAIMGITILGMSVPNFLLAILLMLLVGVKLEWLPVAGYQPLSAGLWNHLKYLILPAISLGAAQAALIARMTRNSMLEVLNANFIKAARAKGVKESKIIYRHALRNAFLPILTVIGQSIGSMVAGAVVAEIIFNIPGIGQLIINSVERRDYFVIQGVVLFVTFFYILINLFIDLLYSYIDPRVRIK